MKWVTETDIPVAKKCVIGDDNLGADEFLRLASEGSAVVWKGDFHNGKQLLQAVDRRLKAPSPSGTPTEIFHRFRQFRSHRARIMSRLLVEIDEQHQVTLRRSPDLRKPIQEAHPETPGPFQMSLRELLGLIGASQWREKGLHVQALGERIFPHYGVFAPVRQEYLDLVKMTPLSNEFKTAFDIGTGTGVISAILAKRGIEKIIATDIDERAINCARENLAHLGLSDHVQLEKTNLFPVGQADLIVCNPPWMPGRPTSRLEQAIFDEKSQMLRTFLQQAPNHLTAKGEIWLIISDLAEHLGLRSNRDLSDWTSEAKLRLIGTEQIQPQHPKSRESSDPLSQWRSQEITRLFRFKI